MAGEQEWAEWAARHSKDRVDEDQRLVSHLLDREWDPIGVYIGSPEDQASPGEYLTYAGWIVAALRSGGGRADIEEALHQALVNMGIGSSPDKTRRAVELVLQWWEARR